MILIFHVEKLLSGLFPTDDEVEELAKFMDGDGSGKIELNELVKNMAFQVYLYLG